MKHRIRINNAWVYLDDELFALGAFAVAPGTMSEQCEGCGDDINDTGALACLSVVCDCGVGYAVEEAP